MRIPTIIITGFLGSGKTTLIKHLLETALNGKRVALIENEIGAVSVDTLLLKTANVQISEITSGCMCCTVSGEFSEAVTDILNGVAPEILLIETTGIANPLSVFMMLANDPRLILDSIITVADAEHLEDHLAETLVTEIQVTIADILVLNKCDVAAKAVLDRADALIRKLNTRAPIFKTHHSMLPPEVVRPFSNSSYSEEMTAFIAEVSTRYEREIALRLEAKQPASAFGSVLFPMTATPSQSHEGHSHRASESYHLEVDEIETFVFRAEGLFSKRDVEAFLSEVPLHCYRIKGTLNLIDYPNPVILNFASGRFTLDFETFRDAAPGSTGNCLVFIGKRLLADETRLTEALMTLPRRPLSSLCTPD